MPRRSKKRKAKQILVTKEKLQQLEQAKQEEIKQEIVEEVKQEPVKQKRTRKKLEEKTEIINTEIKNGGTFITTNVGTVVIDPNMKVPFVDMLGEKLNIGDNVVYVSSRKGKVSTQTGKISNFTNKNIVVLTENNDFIKVRNVIKLEVTKKIVRKVVKQEIKRLSILEYIKDMFIKR